MSWCSKWLHGSEWPEGVELTLGYDRNVRRYVPEAENVALRELVRDMVEWAYISDYCDLEDEFADRMRELGIEVDG